MSGINASTVSRRVKSALETDNKILTATDNEESSFEPVACSGIKTAEMDTGYGEKLVALIPAKLIFAWLVDDNRDLSLKMGECGATVFIHQLAGFKVTSEAIATEPKLPPLPPAHIQVTQLIGALERVGIELDNPRWSQGLKDLTLDILGVSQNRLPTADPNTPKWCGVAERAEQLGYPVALVTKYRSQLGKWVKASGFIPKQEVRLCNGTERPINLYLMCNELDMCIKEYLEVKLNVLG